MDAKKDPVLFVFAHQDDELAYLGLMRRLLRNGRDIRVIWITNGAYSIPAEVRRRESARTMEMLGIGDEGLDFWEYPDGRAIEFAAAIIDRLREVMEELGPGEVYTIAFEGGHPDHDLAHFATVTAAGDRGSPIPVFEAPLYNKYGTRFVNFNRFIPDESEILHTPLNLRDAFFKLRATLNYRSQLRIPSFLILLLAGNRMPGRGEPYRKVAPRDYLRPPHQGKLFYEGFYLRRKLSTAFADFRDAVAKVGSK